MPVELQTVSKTQIIAIPTSKLKQNQFSISIYGDPAAEIDDLLCSIRENGVLVPLVVVPDTDRASWEIISGHRRLACARALGIRELPCEIRHILDDTMQREAVVEYNRQRSKTFTQLMREADAFEELWGPKAASRRLSNLSRGQSQEATQENSECRNSDTRFPMQDSRTHTRSSASIQASLHGRLDVNIAKRLAIGGKDRYRQARAIWQLARTGDIRAQSGVSQLDAGKKTIHAAYKDLRRRNCYSADFRPTPYDVWHFRHDRAFGIPHPGSIPPAIVAHALHYFTHPGGLVIDPMAGGGTTLDVCAAMGRRCLAYDIHPTRSDISEHDISLGFPADGSGCDLIFCDPPYHTMLAAKYSPNGIASAPFSEWVLFLHRLARNSYQTLRPGGYLVILLAAQTEKSLPPGLGYLDHAFLGFTATLRAGFIPERRISCPMDGAYLPQHVRLARRDGRLLGQVRDLLVARKPLEPRDATVANLFLQDPYEDGALIGA